MSRGDRAKGGVPAVIGGSLLFLLIFQLTVECVSDSHPLANSRDRDGPQASTASSQNGAGSLPAGSRLSLMAESRRFRAMTSPGRRRLNALNVFDVTSYLIAGSDQDSSSAFLKAFTDACEYTAENPKSRATVWVPPGRTLLTQPFSVNPYGPQENKRCSRVTFQNDGVIQAPKRIADWAPLVRSAFISIWGMDDFDLIGGEYFGYGEEWWSKCKDGCTGYPARPKFISFGGCSNVYIAGLTIRNPPAFQIMIDGGNNVLVENIRLFAPEESPNTDGLHLSRVFNAVFRRSYVETGDDCAVVQTDSHDILIHNIDCVRTHGISIGSLGNGGTQSCVRDIEVRDSTFNGCVNGARIKSWAGGQGAVKNVLYRNLTMTRVKFPIKLDQTYGDRSFGKGNVAAFNLTFQDISGTTVGKEGVFLDCDPEMPCGASFFNIDLKPAKDSSYEVLEPLCVSAYGVQSDTKPPLTCLSNKPPSLDGVNLEAMTCGYAVEPFINGQAFAGNNSTASLTGKGKRRRRPSKGKNWEYRRRSGYNVGRTMLGLERFAWVESQWKMNGKQYTIKYKFHVQLRTGWDQECDRYITTNISVPLGNQECSQLARLPSGARSSTIPNWGWGDGYFAFFKKVLRMWDCNQIASLKFSSRTPPKMATIWVEVMDTKRRKDRIKWLEVPAFVPNC